MPIPDFQTCMFPVLELAGDGKVHSLGEAREFLAGKFELTEQELNELLPSGRQRRFSNRVAWAKVYLEQAGLVSTPQRGHFLMADRGRSLLSERPVRIDISLLERYSEFQEFRNASRKSSSSNVPPIVTESATGTVTPEELLETAYQSIRAELESDLLTRVKGATPTFFEHLVVELLIKMGYGGNRAEAGRAIGGSGDEGIDGIINEDRRARYNLYTGQTLGRYCRSRDSELCRRRPSWETRQKGRLYNYRHLLRTLKITSLTLIRVLF